MPVVGHSFHLLVPLYLFYSIVPHYFSCGTPVFSLQENEFLKTALMMPWTLSTSQQPQQQIADTPDCSLPEYQDKVSTQQQIADTPDCSLSEYQEFR